MKTKKTFKSIFILFVLVLIIGFTSGMVFKLNNNNDQATDSNNEVTNEDVSGDVVYDKPIFVDVFKTDVNSLEPNAIDGTLNATIYYPGDANTNMDINVTVLDENFDIVTDPITDVNLTQKATYQGEIGDDKNKMQIYSFEFFWVPAGQYHLSIYLEGNDIIDESFITPLVNIYGPTTSDITFGNKELVLNQENTENQSDGSFSNDAEFIISLENFNDPNGTATEIEYILYGASSTDSTSNVYTITEPINGQTSLSHTFSDLPPDRYSGFIYIKDGNGNIIESISLNSSYYQSFNRTVDAEAPEVISHNIIDMVENPDNTFNVTFQLVVDDALNNISEVNFQYTSNDSRDIRNEESGRNSSPIEPTSSNGTTLTYQYTINNISSADEFDYKWEIVYFGGVLVVEDQNNSVIAPADLGIDRINNLSMEIITSETATTPATPGESNGQMTFLVAVDSFSETFIDQNTVEISATNTLTNDVYYNYSYDVIYSDYDPSSPTNETDLQEIYKITFFELPAGTYDFSIALDFYGGDGQLFTDLETATINEYNNETLPIENFETSFDNSNFEKDNGSIYFETNLNTTSEIIATLQVLEDNSWVTVDEYSSSDDSDYISYEFNDLSPNTYRLQVTIDGQEFAREYFFITEKDRRVPGADANDGATISYDYKTDKSDQAINELNPEGELIDLETGAITNIEAVVNDPDNNIDQSEPLYFVLEESNVEVGRKEATSSDNGTTWEPINSGERNDKNFNNLASGTYQLYLEFSVIEGEFNESAATELVVVPEGRDPRKLSAGAISGIVIGVLAFVGISGSGFAYYYLKIK